MDLKNRTILLTGGTSGIGSELVPQLRSRDTHLVVLGRSQSKLDRLAEGGGVSTYLCDLSRREQIEKVMDEVIAQHPEISVLINNAAVQFTPSFVSDAFDYDSIQHEVTVNLTAPLWLTSLLLAGTLLQQEQARIVNVSSGLAFFPKTVSAVYCATKAALHSVSQSLRYQLEGSSVGVTEVVLPLVDTPMTHGRGRGKLSAERAAAGIIQAVETDRDEVYLGKARFLPFMARIAPQLMKNILKRS